MTGWSGRRLFVDRESIDGPQANSSDRLEVLPVPRHDAEASLESRRRDQRIGESRTRLPRDAPRSLRNCSVDLYFAERRKQPGTEIGRGVASKQLSSGHDRIVHSVSLRLKLGSAT